MVMFHSLCDGTRMVRKTKLILDCLWNCLVFSLKFWARYLTGGYPSCIMCSNLYGVFTAFMLCAKTY